MITFFTQTHNPIITGWCIATWNLCLYHPFNSTFIATSYFMCLIYDFMIVILYLGMVLSLQNCIIFKLIPLYHLAEHGPCVAETCRSLLHIKVISLVYIFW